MGTGPDRSFEGSALRYNTILEAIFSCAQKLTGSQLNLPHGIKNQKEY